VSIFSVGNWEPRAATKSTIIRIAFVALSYSQSEKDSNLFSALVRQFIAFIR